jgi:chorismate mutase
MNDTANRSAAQPDTQQPDMQLRLIRARIDSCDNRMLDILAERFKLVEDVKALKSKAPVSLPLRPAREQEILRRLVGKAKAANLSPELLVRLWPLIISQASQIQAPVTIHVAKKLFQNISLRMRIRDYYGVMPVEDCKDEAQAMLQVDMSRGDICIVETESPWVEPFVRGGAGAAQVIATLPVLREGDAPKLLVIGHATPVATGDDETLLISKGALPRAFSPTPLWQAKSGDYRISALPGFLSANEQPFVGLTRSNAALGLKVVGHYPSPIEV